MGQSDVHFMPIAHPIPSTIPRTRKSGGDDGFSAAGNALLINAIVPECLKGVYSDVIMVLQ